MRLFLLPIYLRTMQERDVKVVTTARLRVNLAHATNNTDKQDTASAANIATTQPGFNSRTGYATDYKFRASDMANFVTVFVAICNNKILAKKSTLPLNSY